MSHQYETDDGNIHMNPIEKTEADKELDATLAKKDIPFPGDGALGPEGI